MIGGIRPPPALSSGHGYRHLPCGQPDILRHGPGPAGETCGSGPTPPGARLTREEDVDGLGAMAEMAAGVRQGQERHGLDTRIGPGHSDDPGTGRGATINERDRHGFVAGIDPTAPTERSALGHFEPRAPRSWRPKSGASSVRERTRGKPIDGWALHDGPSPATAPQGCRPLGGSTPRRSTTP